MDDNEYVSESDRRPHLSLERHLTVGPHIYQLTAAGTGDDRIGLTLVGWNATGEVVSEISGGISPTDLAPVADALTSTLAGLATLRRQRLTATPAAPQPTPSGERPKRHRNQGVRWSTEDDARLATRHGEGATIKDLMEEFGRSRPGITARLEHLGLIDTVTPKVWNAGAKSVPPNDPEVAAVPDAPGELTTSDAVVGPVAPQASGAPTTADASVVPAAGAASTAPTVPDAWTASGTSSQPTAPTAATAPDAWTAPKTLSRPTASTAPDVSTAPKTSSRPTAATRPRADALGDGFDQGWR